MNERYLRPLKLGPVEIEPDDWQYLVRHVKAYCIKEEVMDVYNLMEFPSIGDVLFIIIPVRERDEERNRILILLTDYRLDGGIPNTVKRFKDVIAFGVVKHDTDSLKPDDEDFKLSLLIDKKVGRPVYYIIMNKNFEYKPYKNPARNFYGLLQPVDSDEEVKVEKIRDSGGSNLDSSETEETYDPAVEDIANFKCSCGAYFMLPNSADKHIKKNPAHRMKKLGFEI